MKLIQFVSLILLLICTSISLSAQTDSTQSADSTAAQSDSTVEEEKPAFTRLICPSLGITFQNISKTGEETQTLQWLANLQARLQYEGESFATVASLYLQFGQLHRQGSFPEKTQDNLIASITPSLVIIPSTGIRLFFETTGETTMKAGMIDTAHTAFMDPLFLYQSLFIGQKFMSTAANGSGELSFTYGVGYAIQQTITHNFILQPQRQFKTSTDNPLSSIEVETGISALIDIIARKQIGENFQFNMSFKTVLLGKETTWKDYTKSRIASLANLSLSYSYFNLEYNMRLVYDSNYSLRRQIDQSLVAGLRFTI